MTTTSAQALGDYFRATATVCPRLHPDWVSAAHQHAIRTEDHHLMAGLASRADLPAPVRAHLATVRQGDVRAAWLTRPDLTLEDIQAALEGETRSVVLNSVLRAGSRSPLIQAVIEEAFTAKPTGVVGRALLAVDTTNPAAMAAIVRLHLGGTLRPANRDMAALQAMAARLTAPLASALVVDGARSSGGADLMHSLLQVPALSPEAVRSAATHVAAALPGVAPQSGRWGQIREWTLDLTTTQHLPQDVRDTLRAAWVEVVHLNVQVVGEILAAIKDADIAPAQAPAAESSPQTPADRPLELTQSQRLALAESGHGTALTALAEWALSTRNAAGQDDRRDGWDLAAALLANRTLPAAQVDDMLDLLDRRGQQGIGCLLERAVRARSGDSAFAMRCYRIEADVLLPRLGWAPLGGPAQASVLAAALQAAPVASADDGPRRSTNSHHRKQGLQAILRHADTPAEALLALPWPVIAETLQNAAFGGRNEEYRARAAEVLTRVAAAQAERFGTDESTWATFGALTRSFTGSVADAIDVAATITA